MHSRPLGLPCVNSNMEILPRPQLSRRFKVLASSAWRERKIFHVLCDSLRTEIFNNSSGRNVSIRNILYDIGIMDVLCNHTFRKYYNLQVFFLIQKLKNATECQKFFVEQKEKKNLMQSFKGQNGWLSVLGATSR